MSILVRAGEHGDHTARIPALVAIGATLVAFWEGRRDSSSDTGEIVIRAATSTDGGATWSVPAVVTALPGRTCGNPVPVVLDADTILLVSTSNAATAHERDIVAGTVSGADSRRVHVQHVAMPELGATAPDDITASAKRDDWGWYATGPGHGLTLSSGRIVIPADHSVLPAPEDQQNRETVTAGSRSVDRPVGPHRSVYGAHLLLSDDRGRSWRIGHVEPGVAGCSGPNESSAALGADGDLVVSIRNEHRSLSEPTRALARSGDGGLTATLEPRPDLVMPRVQSALLDVPGSGSPVLVMSGPTDPQSRADLGLRHSVDGGRTWSAPWIVAPGPAAYSDLAITADGSLHLLHEGGELSPYELIRHHRIPAAALGSWFDASRRSGQPAYGAQSPV